MLLLAEDCVSSHRTPGDAENSPEGTTCKTPDSSHSCTLPLLLLLSFGSDKAQIFRTFGMCFHSPLLALSYPEQEPCWNLTALGFIHPGIRCCDVLGAQQHGCENMGTWEGDWTCAYSLMGTDPLVANEDLSWSWDYKQERHYKVKPKPLGAMHRLEVLLEQNLSNCCRN